MSNLKEINEKEIYYFGKPVNELSKDQLLQVLVFLLEERNRYKDLYINSLKMITK